MLIFPSEINAALIGFFFLKLVLATSHIVSANTHLGILKYP